MSTRFLLSAAVLLALGSGVLTLYWQWPSELPGPSPAPAAQAVPTPAAVQAVPPATAVQPLAPRRRLSQPLVPAMADTEIDGALKTDAAGNLLLDLALRDYFDYFLSAADQAGLEAAVAALLEDAGSRLQEPALGQLSRLLGDYLDYKRASLALLQRPLNPLQKVEPQAQLAALQKAFGDLAQLRRAHLAPAAVEAFFGAEEAYGRYTLESLALQAREDLSSAAKASAVEALRAQLPEAQRASEERQVQIQAQQAETERLRRAGADEEQLRSFLGMTYDPPTVERLLAEQRAEHAWQQRYADYRRELGALASSGLSAADRQQESLRLRQRLFNAEDQHRVETYDAIAAKQELAANPVP